jgi:hypothetical protein
MFTTIIQIILTPLIAFLVPILSAMVINYLERKISAAYKI